MQGLASDIWSSAMLPENALQQATLDLEMSGKFCKAVEY